MVDIDGFKEESLDINLIELRTLKPLDIDTYDSRELGPGTNKVCILDESIRAVEWALPSQCQGM